MSYYYVPVTGHISPYLAYEHWPSHPERSVPYILKVTKTEVDRGIPDLWKDMTVRVIGQYISVPEMAIYKSLEEAERAIITHLPKWTLSELNAASS